MIQRICFNSIACVYGVWLLWAMCMSVWVRVCMYGRVLEFLRLFAGPNVLYVCKCASWCSSLFSYVYFCQTVNENPRPKHTSPSFAHFPKCKCARHKTQKNGQLYTAENRWKWIDENGCCQQIFNMPTKYLLITYARTRRRAEREREREGETELGIENKTLKADVTIQPWMAAMRKFSHSPVRIYSFAGSLNLERKTNNNKSKCVVIRFTHTLYNMILIP